jgi:hypothetical protein
MHRHLDSGKRRMAGRRKLIRRTCADLHRCRLHPERKTAQVVSGAQSVEILQGEGRLTILAGSLALLGKEHDPSGRVGELVAVGCGVGEVAEPAGGCAPGALAGAVAEAVGGADAAGLGASILTNDKEIAGTLTISKGLAARLARENEAQDANEEAVCRPSDTPNFEDRVSHTGTGLGMETCRRYSRYRGGAWYNPDTGESLRPALDDEIHGSHYDYKKPLKLGLTYLQLCWLLRRLITVTSLRLSRVRCQQMTSGFPMHPTSRPMWQTKVFLNFQ